MADLAIFVACIVVLVALQTINKNIQLSVSDMSKLKRMRFANDVIFTIGFLSILQLTHILTLLPIALVSLCYHASRI